MARPAQALCIGNQANIPLVVWVTATEKVGDFTSMFRANIDPGTRACCDWRKPECNPSGRGDTVVHVVIDPLDTGRKCYIKIAAAEDMTILAVTVWRQFSNCTRQVR